MPLELNALETRILGCLLEKERQTPENYPLSLHSLTAACNQSTNRDPVTAYDEKTVEEGLNTLREKKLDEAILRHVEKGKLFLGICLGLQLLMDVGYEDGEHRGLGIIAGKCVRFDVDSTLKLKVPHMGWNQLMVRNPSPLFAGMVPGSGFYFVHGYHVVPKDSSVIATETDYGRPFVSSIRRDNIMATQFHPEKSQKAGLKVLANFAQIRS